MNKLLNPKNTFRGKALKGLLALLLATTPMASKAATLTWNAGGGNPSDGTASWNASNTNWWDGIASGTWTNGSDVQFGVGTGGTNAYAVTLGFAPSVGNVSFTNQNYTLTGGTMTLAGTGTSSIAVSAAAATINSTLAGTTGLIKSGTGTLILGGTNTYTGATSINGGFIQVSGITNTLGASTTGTVNLNGGGVILASTGTLAPAWKISVAAGGGTLIGNGSLGRWTFPSNSLSGSGTLTLKSAGGYGRFIGSSQSSFNGAWVIDGSGNAFFQANSDNNFGATPASYTSNAITLINAAQIAGANQANVVVGSANRGITIGSGGAKFTPQGVHIFTVAGAISSTGADQVQYLNNGNTGGGVKISNTGNSYSGDTYVAQLGTGVTLLQLGNSEVIPNGVGKGSVKLNATGVLDLNGFNETINGLNGSPGSYVLNTISGTTAALTVGDNNTTSTFGGVIQDNSGTVAIAVDSTGGTLANNTGGTLSLAKVGTGVFYLTGTNTFSGGTWVHGGTLDVKPSALGSGTVTLKGIDRGNGASDRGTLAFSGTITGKTLVMDGSAKRAVLNITGASSIWNGNITLSGASTPDGAAQIADVSPGSVTLLGTIDGSNGGQGLLIRGASANNVLGSTVSIGSNALSKADLGTWTVTSTGNVWGATSISGGTLKMGATNALPVNTALTFTNNTITPASVNLNGYDLTIGSLSGGNSAATNVALGGNTLRTGSAGTTEYDGNITGDGGSLVKTGSTTSLTLTGSNTYSGGTYVEGGYLVVSNANALGSGTVTLNSIGGGRAELDISGSFSGKTLVMDSSTKRAVFGSKGLGNHTWNGTITLSGTAGNDGAPQIADDSSGGSLALLGTINGSNGGLGLMLRGNSAGNVFGATVNIGSNQLSKTDAGTWTISSSGNTWGATLLAMGTFKMGATNALPTDTSLNFNSPGNIATLNLNGFDTTVGSVAGGGTNSTIALGANTLTTGGANTSAQFDGVITGIDGQLVKNGSGMLTLTGTSTYTGATTVNGGKLVVRGALAGSTVGVNLEATLAGNGTVGGLLVADGGMVAPSASSGTGTGILSINGNATLGTSGTARLALEIGSTTAGTGHDQVRILGESTLSLSSVNLEGSLINGFAPASLASFDESGNLVSSGDIFYVVVGAGNSLAGQHFANALVGGLGALSGHFDTISLGGYEFAISYTAQEGSAFSGAGNDIALMAIPEPGTWAMLLGGLGMLMGFQRIRRQTRR